MMKARHQLILASVLLISGIAGDAYCDESDNRVRAFATELTEASTNGGNRRDLVALQLARKIGLFEAATPEDFVEAVDSERTDQHLTASSSTPGALANLEKPGIADLLALAVERGALTETTSGTNVTFSTTPYAIRTALGENDTPDAWEKLRAWRRISTTATFSSEAVTAGDFSSLLSAGLKYVAIGNRSARDAVLMKEAGKTLNASLIDAAKSKGVSCSEFWNTPFGTALNTGTARAFNTWLENQAAATPATIAAKLEELVIAPSTPLDEDTQAKLSACVAGIGNLDNALELDAAQIKVMAKTYLEAASKNQLSFAGLFTRDPESPYKTFKVLYGRDRGQGFSINANAEINLNDRSRSPAGVALDRVRDYSVELGASSPQLADGRADNTFSLKWYLPQDAGAKDVITVQAKLNIRVTGTFAVPVALTYANQNLTTTATVKKGWQLDFGVAALLDHLLANSMAR